MTIQAKFTALLALLGLTVALGLGAALFFGFTLEREILAPMRENAAVLTSLSALKRDMGELGARLPGRDGGDEPASPAARDAAERAYLEQAARVDEGVASLFGRRALELKVGISTARNLRGRIDEARALAGAWFDTGDAKAGRAAIAAHADLHELCERIEARVVENTSQSFDHADAMRRLHTVILASALIGAGLFLALTGLLVRRWVVRPVGELRRAAAEIARGRFGQKVPAAANDELGLLAREVEQMSASIARMQQEAVDRERLAAVGEMVRRIAHNIRNPLSGIRGVAELTRRRAEPGSPTHADQTEIMQTVDRFNQWLNELLRATSPLTVEPREEAPGPWLQGLVDAHQPLARMREVTLSCDVGGAPERARFDPRLLEHALVAILTNGLQASPAGSRVTVAVSQGAERGQWDVAVRDEGPGIPPEIREKIFLPYFTTKRDGNGIGLASARLIVKQHGGRILVDSAPERGTTFLVRLPLGGIESTQSADFSQSAEISRNGVSPGHDPDHRG